MKHDRNYPPYQEGFLIGDRQANEEEQIAYWVYMDLANVAAHIEWFCLHLPSDEDIERCINLVDAAYIEVGGVQGDETHERADMCARLAQGSVATMRRIRDAFIDMDLATLLDEEAAGGEEAGA